MAKTPSGGGGGERGGTPYYCLYWEAPPKRRIFSWLQVYERVGISLVEVYKRVGKSVIWVCTSFEGPKRASRSFVFVIDSYLKDSAFTAVKSDAKF